MAVLVTGANGFIGSALCAKLHQAGVLVRSVVRSQKPPSEGRDVVSIDTLSSKTDWNRAVQNINQIVHLAARVHIMKDKSTDPLSEFRFVNVEGTTALAQQAAAAGVKRFVFLSSIKVNGELTEVGKPFTADDAPKPSDPYGISKHEAEQSLRQIASETGMEVVIVRAPLVYGPGVKANFASMMRYVALGIPLPLGAINNARSMVALDNLVDLLVTCLKHPAAVGETFLASDGEDLSTSDLLRRTARAMGKEAFLFHVPSFVLEGVAAFLGKRDMVDRLCGSLQVDISKTRQLLGWIPPISVDEGLRRAVFGFRP